MKYYYSHGKLLLTGEYAILDGALGLALPTRLGQSLTVEKKEGDGLHWRSLDEQGETWFEANFTLDSQGKFKFSSLTPPSKNTQETAAVLASILEQALVLNPSFEHSVLKTKITTKLEFNRAWGLGSSSTLINNIAQWAEVDPFSLLSKTLGGSGYDIACAQAESAILYHLEKGEPVIEQVRFEPTFTNELYFVYLNKKRRSAEAIDQYRKLQDKSTELMDTISSLTREVLECKDRPIFESLLLKHEQLLSKVLNIPTVREALFPDYPWAIKSLGAWGGDFVLATAESDPREYFKKKGFTVVIPYSELIL
ncbi:MAG: GHMP kinase [Bacteroidia bacterium]|nr:GHMP kinase [Bacteroidia bacterium]